MLAGDGESSLGGAGGGITLAGGSGMGTAECSGYYTCSESVSVSPEQYDRIQAGCDAGCDSFYEVTFYQCGGVAIPAYIVDAVRGGCTRSCNGGPVVLKGAQRAAPEEASSCRGVTLPGDQELTLICVPEARRRLMKATADGCSSRADTAHTGRADLSKSPPARAGPVLHPEM